MIVSGSLFVFASMLSFIGGCTAAEKAVHPEKAKDAQTAVASQQSVECLEAAEKMKI